MYVLPPKKGAAEKTKIDEILGESKVEVEYSTSQTQLQTYCESIIILTTLSTYTVLFAFMKYIQLKIVTYFVHLP
jgi:hypothetical protein